jgi:hypothetical protein
MENLNIKALILATLLILITLMLMRVGVVQRGGPELEGSQPARSARLAREIIEEGTIPDEIRAKYTTAVQPATQAAEGRVIANDKLILPPYSRARVSLQTYCLDRLWPAPSSGEKLHLVDISQLLIEDFIPIYEDLMSYSALHPEANLQIQRIVWFMRFLSEGLYVPSYDLVYEDKQLLERVHPGSTAIIERQKTIIRMKQEALKLLKDLIQQLPEEVKEVLRQLSDLGYDVNNPPRDLVTANSIVSRTLQIINTMRPAGAIREDNSEYTLLSNDVAVKTEHPGGASRTTLIVVNPTPVTKTLDFKRYALESGRKAQRLGIGGIRSVEWEQPRWKQVIPPIAPPPSRTSWTFAIITDLHIGRGYEDYQGEDYENYYLTQRLRAVVDQITSMNPKPNFVAVLGDMSDKGQRPELEKARDILNKLHKQNIPYVPVMGNHDYLKDGEDFYRQVFWDNNQKNKDLLKDKIVKNDSDFKNYSFIEGGVRFVVLNTSKYHSFCPQYKHALEFLKEQLKAAEEADQPLIILSHVGPIHWNTFWLKAPPDERVQKLFGGCPWKGFYQQAQETIQSTRAKVLGWFCGHIHGFDGPPGPDILKGIPFDTWLDGNFEYFPLETSSGAIIPVVGTEALMVGQNEPGREHEKGVIRVVKVLEPKRMIHYSTITGDTPALNPKILVEIKPPQSVLLVAHAFTKYKQLTYRWESKGQVVEGKVATFIYPGPGRYTVKLTVRAPGLKEESITRTIEIEEPINRTIEIVSTAQPWKIIIILTIFTAAVLIYLKLSSQTP